MLNWIWAAMVLGSVATAAWTGKLGDVGTASITGAKDAITLLLGLIGPMILFLGVVRIASDAGLLHWVIRGIRPVLRRLFPEVPADHPAMSAMVMNLAANVLGLGNAATPFGLKAMVELDRLNPHPGVATNAMALFLAINATSVTLMLPSGVIAIRAAAGSQNPAAIWATTVIATTCSTLAAVAVSLLLQRSRYFAAKPLPGDAGPRPAPPQDLPETTLPAAPQTSATPSPARSAMLWIALAALGAGLALRAAQLGWGSPLAREAMTAWPLPILLFAFVAYGVRSGTRIYEVAIEGGKEALTVAVRIAPYLVMILAAIAMLRASGALDAMIGVLDPVTSRLGVPGSVLPVLLMKPLSGSGALAVMTDVVKTVGPDTYAGLLASASYGSTETTFYVLAVYLGVIGVKNSRYILPACLIGDLAGYAGAVIGTRFLFPDAV